MTNHEFNWLVNQHSVSMDGSTIDLLIKNLPSAIMDLEVDAEMANSNEEFVRYNMKIAAIRKLIRNLQHLKDKGLELKDKPDGTLCTKK